MYVKVSGDAHLMGVQRTVQNNSNVKSEPKHLACEDQYMLSTFELLFFCRSLSIYGGLTFCLFFFSSESCTVGRVQHSFMHLTPQNTYVAKGSLTKKCHPDIGSNAHIKRHLSSWA